MGRTYNPGEWVRIWSSVTVYGLFGCSISTAPSGSHGGGSTDPCRWNLPECEEDTVDSLEPAPDQGSFTHAPGYTVTTNGVPVGKSNNACQTYPSSVNCRPVIDTINVGDRFLPACQRKGDTVGSNPYWVYGASSHGTSGWIPSWWIDYPYNVLPDVPDCGPPTGRAAFEANGGDQWRNLPVSGVSGAVSNIIDVSAIVLNGTRVVYSIKDGQLYEANGGDQWRNLPVSGVSGVTSVSAINLNGTRIVYTIKNGQVYEAVATSNGWVNLPVSGVSGSVTGSAVSAINLNGTRIVYTVNNGQVYEANGGDAWRNLPVSGISGNVGGSTISAINLNGTRIVYTVNNGQVYEANGGDAWRNLPVSGISGNVGGSTISAINLNGTRIVYTVR